VPASLHILARRVIKRVVASGAVIDLVDHFGDILMLDRLAREIARPPIADHLDLLDAPLVIDDVELKRLSWAAREWLATDAWAWWRDDAAMLDLAYAWAMAHARDKAALQSVRISHRKARAVISQWARGTSANYDAVMAACRYLSPKPATSSVVKPGDRDGDADEIGSVLLTLVTETERPLDFWIFEAPSEMVEAALARIRENYIADKNRMIRALGKDVPPDPYSWHMRATKRFSDAARAFEAKLAEGRKTAGVGLVEAPVSPSPAIDERPGVHGGNNMDEGHRQEAGRENPGGEPNNQEENGRAVMPISELRPAGDQQGRNPIIG